MREIFTSGSVGGAPGNWCFYPEESIKEIPELFSISKCSIRHQGYGNNIGLSEMTNRHHINNNLTYLIQTFLKSSNLSGSSLSVLSSLALPTKGGVASHVETATLV